MADINEYIGSQGDLQDYCLQNDLTDAVGLLNPALENDTTYLYGGKGLITSLYHTPWPQRQLKLDITNSISILLAIIKVYISISTPRSYSIMQKLIEPRPHIAYYGWDAETL